MIEDPGGMDGTTARISEVTWVKFSLISMASPFSLTEVKGAKNEPPALLTSTSIWPNSSTIESIHKAVAA